MMVLAGGDEVRLVERKIGPLLDGLDVVNVEDVGAWPSQEPCEHAAVSVALENSLAERVPAGIVVTLASGHAASPQSLEAGPDDAGASLTPRNGIYG
jgi:hypothetical protein